MPSKKTGKRPRTSTRSSIPKLKETDDRVRYIAERMSRGDWLGGYAMRLEIANAWGISESRIRDLAATAHRVLAFDPEQRDQLRAELGMTCGRILREAMTTRSKISGLPDYKAALEAAVTVARFAGIDLEPIANPDGGPALQVVIHDEASWAAKEARAAAEQGRPPSDARAAPLP